MISPNPSRPKPISPARKSDSELVDEMKEGRPAAFTEAYKRYQPSMVRVARRLVDRSLAEDVTHEAWLAALQRIAGFEGRSTLQTWLCRITSNVAFNALRRNKREVQISSDSSEWVNEQNLGLVPAESLPLSEPEMATYVAKAQNLLDVQLKNMSRTQANALYLTGASSMDGNQISKILSISHGNLRIILHRARADLSRSIRIN